jgi:hypothetical protein
LKAVNPDRLDIDELVDPGEYGLESWSCRLLCVQLFVLSTIDEIFLSLRSLQLLLELPTQDDTWVTIQDDEHFDVEDIFASATVRCAGLPRIWKIINFCIVVVPKMVLTFCTVSTGVDFLMETATIDDMIVNSVSLGFILTLDELITDGLMCEEINELLDKCEPFDRNNCVHLKAQKNFAKVEEQRIYGLKLLVYLTRYKLHKLVTAFMLTAVVVWKYYRTHCEWRGEHWVSSAMYLPKSTYFSVWNYFFYWLHPVDFVTEPYWVYA